MPEIFKKTAKQLNDFWTGLERKKRIRLVILVSLLLVLIIVMTFLLNRKEYVTLYTNLKPAEAGEIMEKLKEMKIDAKPVNDDTIMVLKEQEPGVRMQLSAQGYPKSGFNYDLFMNGIGFGTTDFEKRKYLQFQLQDRLQEAIMTLNGIQRAIVTLSIPDEDSFVFKEDEKPASASVLLALKEDYRLSDNQVRAIEELVSKSIIGLSVDNISIIDNNMRLLNYRTDDELELPNTRYELENRTRDRLQQQVISLLEPVFGYKKVLAAVNVKLNFDKQKTETVRFEPVVDDQGIVVSMTELKERVSRGGEGGVPGQDSNGEIPQYPGQNSSDQDYEKVSETVNYEINQIKEQIESAQGKIDDITVSVVIDSPDMAADVRDRVRSLVAGAVGIDTENVVVDNMRFDGDNEYLKQFNEAMGAKYIDPSIIKDIAIYTLLSIILIITAILIYRLIIEYMRKNRVAEAIDLMNSRLDTEMETVSTVDHDLKEAEKNKAREYIDELVTNRPEEAAQLLRTWLGEE